MFVSDPFLKVDDMFLLQSFLVYLVGQLAAAVFKPTAGAAGLITA